METYRKEDIRRGDIYYADLSPVVGSEQVNAVINRAKQQEQIEAEQKRAVRRKHSREAR